MVSKLLIVDDHEVIRRGLKVVLESAGQCSLDRPSQHAADEKDGGLEVVETAASGEEAIQFLESNPIDLVLLDIRFAKEDGLAILGKIMEKYETKVIVLSAYDNPTFIARAVALGASDYISKTGPANRLVELIKMIIRGEKPGDDSAMSRVQRLMSEEVNPDDLPDNLPLTGREGQVLRHIALGLSNKEIGRSLKISVETVKEHVQNILRKIDANDRTDAAVRAVRAGMLDNV